MGSMDSSMKRIIRAVEEYNRYRSPEAEARLISYAGDEIVVEVTGSFCYTCGFYDYLEDLGIVFEENGLRVEISGVREVPGGAAVTFRLRGGRVA